jgi:hypothetical protein
MTPLEQEEADTPSWAYAALPVFSIVGAIGYLVCMAFNWAPFIYYPVVGEIHITPQSDIGPGMFWYGWIAYAALAALCASLLTLLFPARIRRALGERFAWSLWSIPFGVILIIVFLMRHSLFG